MSKKKRLEELEDGLYTIVFNEDSTVVVCKIEVHQNEYRTLESVTTVDGTMIEDTRSYHVWHPCENDTTDWVVVG